MPLAVRPVVLLALAGALTSAASCSSSPAPQHAVRTLGPFTVTVDEPRVRVAASDRLLLDVDGRALAFATRTATYQEVYGNFRVVDDDTVPWTAATSFGAVEDRGDPAAPSVIVPLHGGASGDLGELAIALAGDGHLTVTLTPRDGATNRAKMAMACAEHDHFAGLGAQTADVDHRGNRVALFTSEHGLAKRRDDDDSGTDWFLRGRKHASYAPIPAVVTSRGTAWVLDTHAYSVFDLCATDATAVSLEAFEGQLRFHLFDGPAPLDAEARMTSFVGRPKMPPPWAFAPWNDALFGPDEVLKFAHWLRDNHIPSSAIWTEDWRGGFTTDYGYRIKPNWKVDATLYPDMPGLTKQLGDLGIAWQVYFNPHVIEQADVFPDAKASGVLVTHASNGAPYLVPGADGTFGGTAFTDLTNPAARAWAKGLMKQALAQGALGWMADFGEWLPVDDARLSGGDPALVHDDYPHLWQTANDEAIAEAGLEGKVAVYFRSAGLYSQSSATIIWAGDQRTDMEKDNGLPVIVPIGLGLAATGFPFFAHDIGGYQFVGNAPTQIRTKETLFRWIELGAFTPVMRTHHGIKVKENWAIDSDAETTAHWKRYAELHVRLYPYFRGLAARAVSEGRPIWRPMGLEHPDDDAAWAVRDQLYVGDGMLVAPVVDPGLTSRPVVLPAGRFVPMLAGAAVTGPTTITADAPMGEIPVYLRAGAMVPLTKNPAETLFENVPGVPGLETTRGDRVVYVALGADGAFAEEDGASYALAGAGTDASPLQPDATGAVDVTISPSGDAILQGAGFTLSLHGHPAGRKIHVVFR